jgi:serine phosphatase RsbU (regulator of sigma subunit)/uncharacterized protein YigA (DUF484 family)
MACAIPTHRRWIALRQHPGDEDLDDYLAQAAERIRERLGADGAFLLLADEADPQIGLQLRAQSGLPPGMPLMAGTPSAMGRIDLAALPTVYSDLAGPADYRSPLIAALAAGGLRSMACAPMPRPAGLLGVAARDPGRFTEDDALLLGEEAERISAAVAAALLAQERRVRRGALSFLAEAGELLAGSLDPDRTLVLAAQLVVPFLASWCAVHRYDDAGRTDLALVWHEDETLHDALEAAVRKAGPPKDDMGPVDWTTLDEALLELGATDRDVRSGSDGYAKDGAGAAYDANSAKTSAEAARRLSPGELLVVPLTARGRKIGLLTLAAAPKQRLPRDAVELAWDLGRRVAVTYDAALAYAGRRETARALQASLLPPQQPEIPGVDIAVVYRPAGSGDEQPGPGQDILVGGDFYDVFEIRAGCWGVAIGDVCGTGAQAAAVTGLARTALRLLAREGLRPPAVLSRLNRAILDEGERGRFLTLLYGEAEPQPDGSLALSLVCAGHPQPLVLRAGGGVETVGSCQPLLGVLEGDPGFHLDTVLLAPGETLLAFTDGATERRRGGLMLESEGLAEALAGGRSMSASGIAARVQRTVEDFGDAPMSDDMAILVLRAVAVET